MEQGGKGKTSLTRQFVSSHFDGVYVPTVEQAYVKRLFHEDIEYTCNIIDTAGQEEFSIMHHSHVLGVDGFVLVYSITSRTTLTMCEIIRDKILNLLGADSVPLVLVGNKTDLEEDRMVERDEAQELADSWGAGFIEASAKMNLNIEEIFWLLLKQIEQFSPSARPLGSVQKKDQKSCSLM